MCVCFQRDLIFQIIVVYGKSLVHMGMFTRFAGVRLLSRGQL